MEKQHYEALQELSACEFLPGSFNKRFSRQLASLPREAELTPKQIRCLKRLYFKYRNQIRNRNPNADFDWTADGDDPFMPSSNVKQMSAIRARYGTLVENIADFWSKR